MSGEDGAAKGRHTASTRTNALGLRVADPPFQSELAQCVVLLHEISSRLHARHDPVVMIRALSDTLGTLLRAGRESARLSLADAIFVCAQVEQSQRRV